MTSEIKGNIEFLQWLGAEIPSKYVDSLDNLVTQSFGGYHLSDFPTPDRRYVIVNESLVLAHAAIKSRSFILHKQTHHGFVLGAVCTHPSFRGQGLGAHIIKSLLPELSALDGDFIVLNCGDSIVGFYEKIGFNKLSPQASYIRNGVHEIDDDPVLGLSLKDDFSLHAIKTDVFPMTDDF